MNQKGIYIASSEVLQTSYSACQNSENLTMELTNQRGEEIKIANTISYAILEKRRRKELWTDKKMYISSHDSWGQIWMKDGLEKIFNERCK